MFSRLIDTFRLLSYLTRLLMAVNPSFFSAYSAMYFAIRNAVNLNSFEGDLNAITDQPELRPGWLHSHSAPGLAALGQTWFLSDGQY